MSRSSRLPGDNGGVVLVVDDHPLCAAAISQALQELDPTLSIICVESIRALEEAAPRQPVRLILLDLKLPDAVGVQGLGLALAAWPNVPICVISGQSDPGTVRQVLAAGANGFIPKTLSFRTLVLEIERALHGERVVPRETGTRENDDAILSPAEARIMKALCLGLQNKQIAFELGISESTVKSHLAHVFAKLHVQNRSQAMVVYAELANRNGGAREEHADRVRSDGGERTIRLD